MKNRLLAALIFALLVSITVKSQVKDNTYIIPFKRVLQKPWGGEHMILKVVNDCSFLKNIPDIPCDISAINCFKLNRYVAKDSIPNQMYVFIGVNESKKEKYVVVDANNNHDFSDDKLYTFSLPDKPLTREEKKERAVAIQITPNPHKNDTINFGINPFESIMRISPDERLEITISFTEYMTAKAQIGGMPVEIDADLSVPNFFLKRDLDEKTNFSIRYSDKANELAYKEFNSYKDTIQINDKLFKLSKVEHPNIYIKEIGVSADSSSVGSFVPVVYAKDIKKNSLVSINDLLKGKYVFIDFWGSWCGPCIESIPKLKDLYEEVKDRPDVMLLGIASESDEKGVEKLKGIIDSKKIGWLNLWVGDKDKVGTTSITYKLDIKSFPIYLIIDNTGKIAYKRGGSYNTQTAIDFFMKLIEK